MIERQSCFFLTSRCRAQSRLAHLLHLVRTKIFAGQEAGSPAGHQRRKRDAVDCTAAQTVAAALLASKNGPYRHGERTKAAIAEQRKFSALLKLLRAGLT